MAGGARLECFALATGRRRRTLSAMKPFLVLLATLTIIGSAPAQTEPNADAKKVMELKTQIIRYQNLGRLSVQNLTVCESIAGYGDYLKSAGGKVKKDTQVMVYYEPLNLFTEVEDESYTISFSQDLVLTTEDGVQEIFRQNDMLKVRSKTASPSLDVFGANTITLTGLPAGKYKLKGVLRDDLRKDSEPFEWTIELVVID